MDPTIIAGVTGAIVTASVSCLSIFAAYYKLRAELKLATKNINTHTDVSVTKLNGMLRNVIASFDRPCWVKLAVTENGETVFRMLEMNPHYENAFNVVREDYIGKTDLEAGWDHDTASRFLTHDLEVWSSGNPKTFTEVVNGKELTFRKMRVTSYTGEARGVFGYSVDTNEGIEETPRLDSAGLAG